MNNLVVIRIIMGFPQNDDKTEIIHVCYIIYVHVQCTLNTGLCIIFIFSINLILRTFFYYIICLLQPLGLILINISGVRQSNIYMYFILEDFTMFEPVRADSFVSMSSVIHFTVSYVVLIVCTLLYDTLF